MTVQILRVGIAFWISLIAISILFVTACGDTCRPKGGSPYDRKEPFTFKYKLMEK